MHTAPGADSDRVIGPGFHGAHTGGWKEQFQLMKAAQAMDAMREMVAEFASGLIKAGRELDGWLLPDPEMMNVDWTSICFL